MIESKPPPPHMRKQTIFSRKLALVLIANFVVSLPLHAETGNRDGRLLVK
jgi:hypothetical protein